MSLETNDSASTLEIRRLSKAKSLEGDLFRLFLNTGRADNLKKFSEQYPDFNQMAEAVAIAVLQAAQNIQEKYGQVLTMQDFEKMNDLITYAHQEFIPRVAQDDPDLVARGNPSSESRTANANQHTELV